jgi:hypothetical protein
MLTSGAGSGRRGCHRCRFAVDGDRVTSGNGQARSDGPTADRRNLFFITSLRGLVVCFDRVRAFCSNQTYRVERHWPGSFFFVLFFFFFFFFLYLLGPFRDVLMVC